MIKSTKLLAADMLVTASFEAAGLIQRKYILESVCVRINVSRMHLPDARKGAHLNTNIPKPDTLCSSPDEPVEDEAKK